MQTRLKTSINTHVIVTKILFRNRGKLRNSNKKYSSKNSSENQGFLMISGRTKVNQFAQICQAMEANFCNS